MKIYIYPYSSKSESAKLLAERLGAKRIKLQNSEYQYSPDHLVINWGNSNCPYPCLNLGSVLQETVDKLRFFRLMNRGGASDLLPRYWTAPDDIPNDAFPIFCRTETQGHDGSGIVIANDRSELVAARLYTEAIKYGTEYRVTAFVGYGITDIQTKRPREGVTLASDMVKTYSNGWGFQRRDVTDRVRSYLEMVVRDVLDTTGLDFCGIDVILKDEGDALKPYVLEVNSAMGLEGGALERFAEAIECHVKTVEGVLSPIPQAEAPHEEHNKDYLDVWLERVPVSPAGGVDWQSILMKIAGRLY